MKKENGITLIALVITIIVLLILAGISVNLAVGQNGVTSKASQAKVATDMGKIRENIAMRNYEFSALNQTPYSYLDLIPEEYKDVITIASNGDILYIGADNLDLKDTLIECGVVEVDNSNLEKIKILWELATEYVKNTEGCTDTATELCLQYIRRNTYNSDLWTSMAGAINSGFVSYVNDSEASVANYNFSEVEVIGDFIHLCGALNAYVYGESTTALSYTISPFTFTADAPDAFCGWAGDFLDLIGQLIANSSNTAQDLLGSTSSTSRFGFDDVIADIDAYNIYLLGTDNLYGAMLGYYYNEADNRVSIFKEYVAKEADDISYSSLSDFFTQYFTANLTAATGIIYSNSGGMVAMAFSQNPSSYIVSTSAAFENWLNTH